MICKAPPRGIVCSIATAKKYKTAISGLALPMGQAETRRKHE